MEVIDLSNLREGNLPLKRKPSEKIITQKTSPKQPNSFASVYPPYQNSNRRLLRMSPRKWRAYVGGALAKLVAPLKLEGIAKPQAMRAPPGPLKVFLRFLGKGFKEDTSNPDLPLRLLEEAVIAAPERSDACTQTLEVGTANGGEILEQGDNVDTCASEVSSEIHPASEAQLRQTILYPDENRVVIANDIPAFLLTKETMSRLHQTIIASRNLKHCQIHFEDVEGEASIGQSFIENAESQINDPNTPAHLKDQIRLDLEQRKPSILDDVRRKGDLQREIGVQMCDLDFLREQLDETFEQMMADAGVIEESGTPVIAETNVENAGVTAAVGLDSPVQDLHETQSFHGRDNLSLGRSEHTLKIPQDFAEMDAARDEHIQAFQNLQMARMHFDQREELYNMDVAEHADGTLECSREEIDLYHVQQGAQLTKNLREAEEEFERTRAQAEVLDILVDVVVPTPETDGYRESQDPACAFTVLDRDHIQRWATGVADAESLPSLSPPSTDWSARSVGISDSLSNCAEDPEQRRWIDRWHTEQEAMRAGFSSDVE